MNSWQVIQTCRLTWPLLALLSILFLHIVPAVGERSGSRSPVGTDPNEDANAETEEDNSEFEGKSIRVLDPGRYSKIKEGDLGHIIRATDVKGEHKPDFQRRHFQLHVDDYAGPVIMTGSQFAITEEGKSCEELAKHNSYIRLLRRPVRDDLKVAKLSKGMLGKVQGCPVPGRKTVQGLEEDVFLVQMLSEPPEMKELGSQVTLLRHEFEVVEIHVPPTIIGHSIIPNGEKIKVHSPVGDEQWKTMLLDQPGTIETWEKNKGKYLVHLTSYKKDVELLPEEVEPWADEPAELQHSEPEAQKAPSTAVAHPHERKDLEYSALEKYENEADGHLKAIKEQMEGKLKEKVDAAHGKHNAYISKVWDNHMGLDDFNDSLDKFRAAHAGKDESGMAELRDLVDKGMTEVKLNTELGRKFQAYNAQRLNDIGRAHGKQNKLDEDTLKSNRALGVPETHPHYKDFAELHKKFPEWIGVEPAKVESSQSVEPAKVESSQSRSIEDDISERLDEETLMKAKRQLLSKAGIGRATGTSGDEHEDELSEDTLKKAMKQIESGYEKERQEKTQKDIAKQDEVDVVETEGQGETEKGRVNPAEVDSADKLRQETAEKDLAKPDEVDAVEKEGQGETEKGLVKPAEVDSAAKLRQETAEKELATQDEVGSVEKLRQKSAEQVDSASNDEALLDPPSMKKKPTDPNVVLEQTPNGAMVKRPNERLSPL